MLKVLAIAQINVKPLWNMIDKSCKKNCLSNGQGKRGPLRIYFSNFEYRETSTLLFDFSDYVMS